MRRRSSQREGLKALSEINVTPMLDLCFVLLVIFMITTPLLENNNDLALPSGAASDHPVEADKVRTLTIDRSEVIALDGETVPAAGLAARLETLRAEKGADVAVVIRPDKNLTVQKLVGVMDALRTARISKVGVITEAAGGAAP